MLLKHVNIYTDRYICIMALRNCNLFEDGQGVCIGGSYKVREGAEGKSESDGGTGQKEKAGTGDAWEESSGGRGCLRHFIKFL